MSRGEPCPLCSGIAAPWCRKNGIEVFACPSCETGFVPPRAIPPDLESIYTAEYFEGGESTGYPSYLADRPLLERNFAERARRIAALRPPGRDLLEIGCAYGIFLEAARDAGFRPVGIEIVPECVEAVERIDGVEVIEGDVLTAAISRTFDVIALFDVLEHLRDPLACLRRAHDLLRPGGIVVIETGDRAAPWARLLGRRWYFIDPPQHVFYFSAAGLQRFLREAGFLGDVQVERTGRRVSLANISFKLSGFVPANPLGRSLRSASRRLSRGWLPLRFGDTVMVAARKRP